MKFTGTPSQTVDALVENVVVVVSGVPENVQFPPAETL